MRIKLQVQNTFSGDTILGKIKQICASFKGNLHGANVRVATNLGKLAIYKEGNTYFGVEYYLLIDVMKRLNFNMKLVHPKVLGRVEMSYYFGQYHWAYTVVYKLHSRC